jgi:PD-(D/E)XK nuclease superfamily
MGNRLSYSSVRLFGECSKKYEFSYVKRLREKTRSGALCFGTSFDKAIEAVLKDRSVDEYSIFDESFTNQELNKRMVHIPSSLLVVYANSDMDTDLLQPDDWKFLAAKASELLPDEEGDSGYLVKQCQNYKKQKAFRTFKEGENKFLNLASWLCLRRKGHMMLKANREKILPMIKEVVGTQVEIKLENQEGDSLIGFVDLVAKIEGQEGNVVIDYKTSTIAYEADSAKNSVQLGIYAHSLSLTRVGYFVFRKQILKNRTKICSVCSYDGSESRAKTCNNDLDGKRCNGDWTESTKPEVDIQIIFDTISPKMEDAVIENIDAVNKAIRAGIFVRNFEACQAPWGRCPYFSLCRIGKDDGSLEEMKA